MQCVFGMKIALSKIVMSHHWIYFLPYVLSSPRRPRGWENDTNEGLPVISPFARISLYLIQWREAGMIITEHFITFLCEVWSFISSPSNKIPVKTHSHIWGKVERGTFCRCDVQYCMLDAKFCFFMRLNGVLLVCWCQSCLSSCPQIPLEKGK